MQVASTKESGAALFDWGALIAAVFGLFLGLLIALKAVDSVMAFHAVVFSLFALAGVAFAAKKAFSKSEVSTGFYADNVVKAATIAAVFWGVVGFLVGDVIAWQLAFPSLNLNLPWTNFGRLRPVHTSAVIFAFGGNVLLATSFHVVQRTSPGAALGRLCALVRVLGLSARSSSWRPPAMSWASPRAANTPSPNGTPTSGSPIVWVVYLLVFLGTHHAPQGTAHLRRELVLSRLHRHRRDAAHREQSGGAGLVLRHKSYSAFSGVQDAMTQWWYGHNAVGFFLTAGFLGIMYYFVPKRAERPVYSYKLSIVHFWTLIFLYIWAGPHHLHYTALPDWAQTLGMTFSIMLWMPSWGGMINGLMTLSGAWDKLRTDPVIRFLVVSVAFYGMSTFEGPLMAIRSVNSLSHYTDWTIGHVHSGALGWVGMVSFGAIYCLVPWLWKRKGLYSQRLVEWHFWTPPSASSSTSPRCGYPASCRA